MSRPGGWLSPEDVIFTALYRIVQAEARAALSAKEPERSEKEKTTALTVRLQTQPKEGKAVGRGNPTASATVHEEGREDAHLYLATFRRHTAKLALTLARDAAITAEGYIHPSNDPSGKRMDTFSIFNLIGYPGKSEKRQRTPAVSAAILPAGA